MSEPSTQAGPARARSYRPGSWFGILGEHVCVVLPPSEKSRVAALWALVDDGAGFDVTLDALISSGLRDLPGFVLVAPVGDETRIVLRGAATATLHTQDGVVRLDGSASGTWTERSLPGVVAVSIVVEPGEPGETGPEQAYVVDRGLVRLAGLDDPALTVPVPAAADAAADVLDVEAPAAAEPVPVEPVVEASEPELEPAPEGVTGPAAALFGPPPTSPPPGISPPLAPPPAPPLTPPPALLVPAPPPPTPVLDGPPAFEEPPVVDEPAVDEQPEPGPVLPPAADPLGASWEQLPEAEETLVPPAAPPSIPPPPPPAAGPVTAPPVLTSPAEPLGWAPSAPAPPTPAPTYPPALAGFPQDADTPLAPTPEPSAAVLEDDEDGDHDGLTRLGQSASDLSGPLPGIPGQPQAPGITARPVARLSFSTGEVVDVDRVVLVGRAPEARQFAAHEQPRLVGVPSPHQEISSTHLEIRPGSGADHGSAVVTDLGSTNGTILTQPGLPAEELTPAIAVQLIPGAEIDLGDGVSIRVTNP